VAKKNTPKFTSSSGKQKTAAQLRLEAKRALAAQSAATQAKRRRRMTLVYTPVGVVIAVVIILVVIASTTGAGHKAASTTSAAPASVSGPVTSVPATVFDQVGAGTASSSAAEALTGSALTADGKPRVLYVGAEWCPYCAAERWPLAVALSRFGTLSGLGVTHSDPNDSPSNIPTLSFADATFTSDYLSFSGNEIQDNNRKTVKTLDAADQALFDPHGTGGSFPYLNVTGTFQFSAQYDPTLLTGLSQEEIAAELSNPNSNVTKAIVGAANVLTAAICKATNDRPADVCTSAGVTAAAKTLP